MAAQANELVVWDNMTPVVNASTDNEFDVWDNMTPDEDRDEGQQAASPSARRRVIDF
jgi:hypothetical protein